MRWRGLIPFALILGILILVYILFMDRWIESGIENTGQRMTGAKVEIDGFHLNLFKLTVQWKRLQAADARSTMRNILETDRAVFRMSFPALLRRRVVIHEMTLADVRSGSPRKTDGALPKKKPASGSGEPDFLDKVKSKIKSEIETMPLVRFDLGRLKRNFNADSLVAITGLRLPAHLDSVKTDAMATASGWDVFFNTFHPEDDLAKVRSDLKDINPKQIKTLSELLSTLNTVQASWKTVKAVSDTISFRNRKFKQDYGRLSAYTGQLKTWFQDDYRNVLAKAQLPDLSVQQVGKMVFGPHLAGQAEQWISRYQRFQELMPKKSVKPEKQKKPRMRGQNIAFPDRHGWPAFTIEKLFLSGQTGPTDSSAGFRLNGVATDISSQPWITGRPMVVSLSGNKADSRSVEVKVVLDHRTESAGDSFAVRFANVSLNHVAIEKSAYLPSQIRKGSADFNCIALVRESAVSVQFNSMARGLSFDFDSTAVNETFVRILRDVISRLDAVTLDAGIQGAGDDIRIRLNSNLDDKVGGELKRVGSQALTDAQNKIMARLSKIENQKRAELAGALEEKQKAFEEKLSSTIKLSEEQIALVQEKLKLVQDEIDKRKKQEEDQLGKKAKDLLDGVLKKK